MTKIVEFENKLGDMVTETFVTSDELRDAIKYYGSTTMASILQSYLHYYTEAENI